MRAIVVYESLWGSTAAVARAVAEGIGEDARALSTGEATAEQTAGADLVVAGAPVLGFNLPTESMRENIRSNPGQAPSPPDFSHPSMRSWLSALPKGHGRAAAFETRVRWSPGGAVRAIRSGLEVAGYLGVGEERFLVSGRYGPLREGELARARRWGETLALSALGRTE